MTPETITVPAPGTLTLIATELQEHRDEYIESKSALVRAQRTLHNATQRHHWAEMRLEAAERGFANLVVELAKQPMTVAAR